LYLIYFVSGRLKCIFVFPLFLVSFIISELLRRKYDTFCSFFFCIFFSFFRHKLLFLLPKNYVLRFVAEFRRIGSTIAHKSKSSYLRPSYVLVLQVNEVRTCRFPLNECFCVKTQYARRNYIVFTNMYKNEDVLDLSVRLWL